MSLNYMDPKMKTGCPSDILFAAHLPTGLRDKINPLFSIIGPFSASDYGTMCLHTVRVLVTLGNLKSDAALMDRLPNLGLICCYGSGYEGVDVAEARRRGIAITHGPAANSSAVADLAVALLLTASRRIVMADKFVRDGRWSASESARMPILRGLTGRRIGIFGYGAIGSKIASRLAAFEAEIAYHSRSRKLDVPHSFHDSLLSLANWADVLIVAARADQSTRHAVNMNVMKALGPEGILVNISRGSIIDEASMIELLQAGALGSAALDVFENEPSVPEALRAIAHTVLTPHIGGATSDAHKALQRLLADNIDAFFNGQRLITPVP